MQLDRIYLLFQHCNGVTTNSRECPENSMFFALKGDSFNGNAYAKDALEKGASYAIVDDINYYNKEDKRYILVDNSLTTLQQLAHYHRVKMNTPIIGITGTNGKTTTKELVAAVLSDSYNVLYTKGNFNNHIGVPLTLLKLKQEHQIAIIEMGANHPGEIKTLVEIAEPNYGIITNVGKAHLEGFGSFEKIIETKGELYDFLRKKEGTIFIDGENKFLMNISQGLKLISYGEGDNNIIKGRINKGTKMLSLSFSKKGETCYNVKTQLIGNYNFKNAMAAIAVGYFFKLKPEKIVKQLEQYQPNNNRSELKVTSKNRLVVDAYNANPTSMEAAINNFSEWEEKPKMVILGDMLELGEYSQHEHQKVIDLLNKYTFEKTWLVGECFSKTSHNYNSFKNVEEVINQLKKEDIKNYIVLIKGSNGIKLTQVIEYL